jgi:hypothetical protein
MRWLCLAVSLSLSGCAHGGAGTGQAVAALSAVAVASAASAISVANGGCAAVCAYGTFCNEHGLCEALPCHASCNYNEACEPKPFEHCVPIRQVPLQLSDLPPPPPAPSDQH